MMADLQHIAMRVGANLYYLLSGHLGSTSITTDANGDKIAELRYTAFGEVRYADRNTPTDYRFTGQLQQRDLGLYFYKARFYDPVLGRFISPDTIVPNLGNPKSWNRYAYVGNNPIRYNDPSGRCEVDMGGHMTWFANDSSQCSGADVRDVYTDNYLSQFDITIQGETSDEKTNALIAAILFGTKLTTLPNFKDSSITDAFKKAVGPVTVVSLGEKMPNSDNCSTTNGTTTCHHAPNIANAIHEYFHAFDTHYRDLCSVDCVSHPDTGPNYGCGPCLASDYLPGEYSTDANYTTGAYQCGGFNCIAHPPDSSYTAFEAFANMGQNWAAPNVAPGYSGFKGDDGSTLSGWMDTWMPIFLKRMGY